MAITKRTEVGAMTVLPDRQIQVRLDTILEEDGKELSRTYFRYVLAPGDNLTGQPASVSSLAKMEWTTAVVNAYKAALAKIKIGAG